MATGTSKIETELLGALTGFKPKSKEERQDYLARLIVAVQKLDDEAWGDLSNPAQKWINAGAKADNDEKEIPDFPDIAAVADDDEEEAPPKKAAKKKPAADDEEEEEAPPKKTSRKAAADDEEEEDGDGAASGDDDGEDDVKTTAKKKAPAKKAAAKEAPAKNKAAEEAPAKNKAAEDKPAKSGKVEGIKADIKKMVIKKPSMTAEEIYDALGGKKAELSKVTISAVRSETRHTLRVLNDMGKLEIKI